MTEKKTVSKPEPKKPDNKVQDLEPTKDTKGGGRGLKIPLQPNPTA